MAGRTKGGPRYYSTGKSAQQFVSEIMRLLGEFGASSFHVKQVKGQPVAIAFTIEADSGLLPFQIEPRFEGVRKRMSKARSAKAEPEAVAWAQARHLIELQLEAVESGVVSVAQAFGGFAFLNTGRTVADMLEERTGELIAGEQLLLPTAKKEEKPC